jgi:NAD-dependent deacetylase
MPYSAINRLKELVNKSQNIVFFGGAGVSTESGIPDFRSVDGLYNTKYDYPPEEILSHSFFISNPAEFYRFYFDKMIYEGKKANACHLKLAKWEAEGKLSAVITQNIDGLHFDAGSENVLELHGSVRRNYCQKCGRFYHLQDVLESSPGIPYCEFGGIIKPDVVLYEEALDDDILRKSIQHIMEADLLIVGGTSLNVYPAAGLIGYAKAPIVIINKSVTPYDRYAEMVVNQPIGEVFELL